MPALEIRFDPGFVEEAVFLELKRLEEIGEAGPAREFHARRAALYDARSPEKRDGLFRELARERFHSLGLEDLFTGRFAEFLSLPEKLEVAIVRRVWGRKEEEVELYRDPAGGAGRRSSATLRVGLLAERCVDRERTTAYLRHELTHIADMLDPAFAYSPERALGGESNAEDDLIRERFRLLWDLWAHGRMRRRGWPALTDAAALRRQFDRAFRFLGPEDRDRVFEGALSLDRFTQEELLALARDERLLKALGAGGVRCPLCRFPTREGVSGWEGEAAAVARAIRADRPEWDPSEGACRQCFDLYDARLRGAQAPEGKMDRQEFLKGMPAYLAGLLRQALGREPAGPESGGTDRPARVEGDRVAVLDPERCLAWVGLDCQLCYVRCPLREKAIVMREGRPVIVPESCDGCGLCEEACRAVNQPPAVAFSKASSGRPAAAPLAGALALAFLVSAAPVCWAAAPAGDPGVRSRVLAEGEFRYRLEYRNNLSFNNASFEDDDIHLLRTRLGVRVEAPSNLRLFAQGQDARSFAGSSLHRGTGFVDHLDLRQLYAEWSAPESGGPVTLKAGRQELAYGDERFVGAFNWSNVARVFDALKGRWRPSESLRVDAWASRVVLADRVRPDSPDGDQEFYGLYGEWRPLEKHSLDSFLFVRHDRDNEIAGEVSGRRGQLKEATVGNRFKGKRDGFDYGLEWAFQFGSRAHDRIRAWALHAGAGHTFSGFPWSPRVGAEFNHGSGDDDPADGTVGSFSNLFPTNHVHYGYMDLASLRNMNNVKLSVEAKPGESWKLEIAYHGFFLDSNKSAWFNAGQAVIRPATPGAGRTVGHEIDLLAGWKASERLHVLAGYSHFFAGSFVDDSGADDDADFFYMQTALKF